MLITGTSASSVSFVLGFSMYVRLFGVRLDGIGGVAAMVDAEEAVVTEAREEEDMELLVEENTVSKTVTSSIEVTCRRSGAGLP